LPKGTTKCVLCNAKVRNCLARFVAVFMRFALAVVASQASTLDRTNTSFV